MEVIFSKRIAKHIPVLKSCIILDKKDKLFFAFSRNSCEKCLCENFITFNGNERFSHANTVSFTVLKEDAAFAFSTPLSLIIITM